MTKKHSLTTTIIYFEFIPFVSKTLTLSGFSGNGVQQHLRKYND